MGVLDDNPISRVEQEAGREIERLVRAVDDDDLLGIADNSTGTLEILGERLSQRSVPLRRTVAQGAEGFPPKTPRHEPPPELVRELLNGRHTIAEIEAQTYRKFVAQSRLPEAP